MDEFWQIVQKSKGGTIMNENDLRVIKTEKIIKQTIIELLQRKEIKQITVNDICKSALIGRSTFYNHFQDKYEVLEKMVEEVSDEFAQMIKKRFENSDITVSLNDLATTLKANRVEFLTLLAIHEEGIDLTSKLNQILHANFLDYFKKHKFQQQLKVSEEFAADLYCANSLVFLKWALKNDDVQQTIQFLNEIQKVIF